MKDLRKGTNCIIDRSYKSISSYFRDINKAATLTAEEEAELAITIRKGGPNAVKAKEKLISANLKFVVTVANQYKSSVLELQDLISEGNLGLIKAAELYDESKGFKFITYAVWWIRQSIMKAIEHYRPSVRIPQNQQHIVQQYKQLRNDVRLKEQRNVSVLEFCEVSGYDYERVSRVLDAARSPIRLDKAITEDSDATFSDFFASDSVTDSNLDKESMRIDLIDIVDHFLTSRESFIVKKIYGIGCEPMQLDDVAEEIHLSRERTRQICGNALRRIRNSANCRARLGMHMAA